MAINSDKNTRNSYTLSKEAYKKLEELCVKNCRSKSSQFEFMINYFYDMEQEDKQKDR